MFRKSADDSGFGTNCTIGQICSGMQWKTCFAEFTGAQTPTTPRFSCHVNWVMGIHGAYQDAVVADFNGDGIADMAEQVGNNDLATTAAAYACPAGVNGVTTSCWRVCISAGDGAFQFTDPGVRFGANALGNPAWIDSQGNVLGSSPTDLNSVYNVPRCRYWVGPKKSETGFVDQDLFGDFNGDGRTDILSRTDNTNGNLNVCLSQGTESFFDPNAVPNWSRSGQGFKCEERSAPTIIGSDPVLGLSNFKFVRGGDFSADGITDLVATDGVRWVRAIAGGATPTPGDLLTKITDGLGATTRVDYSSLIDASVYTKGTSANLAIQEIDIQSPMYVVKQAFSSNGNVPNADIRTDYSYEGLRGSTTGRGVLGFAKRTIVEIANDSTNKVVVAITDTTGTLKQRVRYDAWGGRVAVALVDPYLEERGYTGHEHLDEVGLVHMNGRIYDPASGRFLQADPIVQSPENSQSYNRYSYVMNNPLSLTDPSGYAWWNSIWTRRLIRSATLGAAVGGDWAGAAFNRQYAYPITQNPDARMVGAAVAAYFAFYYAAPYGGVPNSFGAGVAGSTAAGFAAGGIQGGNLQSALYGAFAGAATGGIFAGIADFVTPTQLSANCYNCLASNSATSDVVIMPKEVVTGKYEFVGPPHIVEIGKYPNSGPAFWFSGVISIIGPGGPGKVAGPVVAKGLTAAWKDFFAGTKYTDKVLGQMKKGDLHAFPETVKGWYINHRFFQYKRKAVSYGENVVQ